MGFARRTLRLVFEGPDFEGLQVRARPMSIAQLLEAGRLDADEGNGVERLDRFLPYLAAALIDWNLEEDDGTPVPPTLEALRSLDMGMLTALINAWTAAAAGVAPPLEPSSNGGGRSLEVSLPMEVLSPSLPS